MADTPLYIPSLEERKKFTDYRQGVWGNSYSWAWVRAWTDIKYIVFHHSVTKPTSNSKADVDYIAQIHKNNGWGGIGYHFVITADGMVWYVGDISTARANVADKNEKVIGICLVGDFTQYNPTDDQIISGHDLAKYLINDIPALVNVGSWESVVGHKELQATQCPGTNWKGPSDSVFERIKNRIPYTLQPQPDPIIDWQVRYSELSTKYQADLKAWEERENGYIADQLALEVKMAEDKAECQGKIKELVEKLANANSQNPQIPKLSDFPDSEIFAEFIKRIINKLKFKRG